jgi:hypothetical protein
MASDLETGIKYTYNKLHPNYLENIKRDQQPKIKYFCDLPTTDELTLNCGCVLRVEHIEYIPCIHTAYSIIKTHYVSDRGCEHINRKNVCKVCFPDKIQ